jgi:alpha-1,2-mannosyltransferase
MSRTARVAVVAGIALVTTVFAAFASARHGLFDLRVYYGAVNYWAHDGGMIYDFGLSVSHYGFTYPPFAALTMLPMAVLSLPVTIVVATAASVVAAVLLLWLVVTPAARRAGSPIWYATAVAGALAIALDPVRETFTFGQVNLLLAALVAVDLLVGVAGGRRWAGIGTGLATAVKLTPGVFIVYLAVTRRWRAALVAAGTAAVATLVAAAVDPEMSRVFWTGALWDTDRVGNRSYVGNQSLSGAVARLAPAAPADARWRTVLWLVLVVAALAVWFVRVRRAAATGDETAGLALTAVLGCLVSPVTWVHHLVWLAPALVLLAVRGLKEARGRRRAALLGLAAASYLILCSRLVWAFDDRFAAPLPWLASNAYVWVAIALLLCVPLGYRRSPVEGVADLGQLGAADRDRRPVAVEDESAPLVEPPRPRVVLQHP